jgi:phosphate-selective porin OprO/OprP
VLLSALHSERRRLSRSRLHLAPGVFIALPQSLFVLAGASIATAQTPFQVHGYIQGRFTEQEPTKERLEVRRARLTFSGNSFAKLSYAVQFDVAKKPYLMDVNFAWDFSRSFRLTAGQFKTPFSAESLIADNLNAPIARSRAVNALAPGRDIGVQGRDAGVQLSGGLLYHRKNPTVEYAVAVLRGQVLIQAPSAHFPAISGRVLLHPRAEWTVGGAWYASFSAPPQAVKRREGAEAGYQHGQFDVRAEQIWARDGALERRGGYMLGRWRLSEHWEPLIRADWLTKDVHRANATSVAYIVGVNYVFGKHAKLGANAGAQLDQASSGLGGVLLAQMMLLF